MALNLHPADEADIVKIGTATHFNVHLRISPTEKIDRKAKTLAAAIKIADELGTTPGGRKPLIYAVTPDRMIVQARQEIEQKAATDHKRARAGVEALGHFVTEFELICRGPRHRRLDFQPGMHRSHQ